MYIIVFLSFFLITFILREYFLVLQLRGVFFRQAREGELVRETYLYPGREEDPIFLKVGFKKRTIIRPAKINERILRLREPTDINVKKFSALILILIYHLIRIFYFINFSFLSLFLSKDISRSVLYFIKWNQLKISDIILQKIYKVDHSNLVLI